MNDDQAWNDILRHVEKPGRYIGGEWNAVRKDPTRADALIALAFPDVYEIGMSYLGQKILYSILNRHPALLAERVFAPWPDLEMRLRSERLPLFSLENKIPLNRFDIIGFSLLYELNYSNILTMLDLGGIPVLARDRGDRYPLVIAGGPAAFNPEPVSDIFDAFLLGDGEEAVLEIVARYLELKKGGAEKDDLLAELARIPGVYVPALYDAYFPFGSPLLARRPKDRAPAQVTKRIFNSLGNDSFPEDIVVPDIQAVFDRVAVEVARGCPQRCRFCQATNIYFPFRTMSPSAVLRKVFRSLCSTGYEDVSLSALSVSDYPFLEGTVTALMDTLAGRKISLSLSSLRPKGLSASVAEDILKVRKTGFTLVPEAGTDRLRRVINKNLNNQEILEAAATAFGRGWQLLKLYFMVGLPTETDEDLEGICRLVEEIVRLGRSLMRTTPRINLSLSSFIPKPHTPFQWLAMEQEKVLREKQRFVHSRLSRLRSVAIKDHPTRNSVLEAVFSRGDRRLGSLLVQAWNRGARFDSWKEFFEFSRWEEAFAAEGLDSGAYLGSLEINSPLPWDHILTGIKKEFLLTEWKKAERAETTAPCLEVGCAQCLGCDFPPPAKKGIAQAIKTKPLSSLPFGQRAEEALRFEVSYSKSGFARYLSHRDLTNHLQRALRRAAVEVAHSGGFHPKMLVSYAPALPLGMEAKEECFEFRSFFHFEERAFLRRLNRSARSGIRFLRLRVLTALDPPLSERIKEMVYSVDLQDSEVRRALEARMMDKSAERSKELEFVEKEMKRFLDQNLESRAVAWVDRRRRRLFLQLPHLSRRNLRPQDVISAVLGIDNASFYLTRERFIFDDGPGQKSLT
jgi:radical SAM family uncharacterized protein/radical SAM-linked protein